MRKVAIPFAALFLAGAFSAAPPTVRPARAEVVAIPISSYDVSQTPMSGYGCWTHTYDGSIVDTGRTVTGSVTCGSEIADHLANYSGGSGTLNDGIYSTTSDDNQLLLTTMNSDDGLPIEPVITLHLAQTVRVKGISIYGGDVSWNALPGALNAATIEIGGESLVKTSTPFGTPNVLGVPPNDDFDIDYTVESWIPTRTIVLKDFQADVLGFPFNQFSITEITVRGDPIQMVAIDVKPGEKNPVTITTGDPVRGKLPIAIYGSSTFNAGKVDLGSLSFGVNGWESNPLWCNAPQDLNKDGHIDLLCHFMNNSASWEQQGLTTLHLNGRTLDDAYFHGTDTAVVAPR